MYMCVFVYVLCMLVSVHMCDYMPDWVCDYVWLRANI